MKSTLIGTPLGFLAVRGSKPFDRENRKRPDPFLQRVDDQVVFVVESVPPDVEGRPVAEVEEDEQEREHDEKDEIGPAVIVRGRASNWAVLAAAVLAAAAAVALVLHLASVTFPATLQHFRFGSGLDQWNR